MLEFLDVDKRNKDFYASNFWEKKHQRPYDDVAPHNQNYKN